MTKALGLSGSRMRINCQITTLRRLWIIIAVLYLITWIGGWVSHQRSLSADARRRYEEAQVREREMFEWYRQEGRPQPRRITRDGGPIAKINWCVPILPGVLLANSEYTIGPLNGRGGVSLLLYYGFGCYQVGSIATWKS